MSENNQLQKTTLDQQIQIASQIDDVVKHVMSNSKSAGFVKAFVQADAIDKISQYLDADYMKPIMTLQNKKLGFKTDQPTGYKMEVVRDCLIEATLYGVQTTGNQFNIISGNVYITKEGFTYLLSQVDGLWQNFIYDIPKVTGAKAIVDVTIEWSINGGEKKSRKLTFSVKVIGNTTDDAILGKTERKAKKWLYYEVTGNDIGEGEAVVQDVEHEVLSSEIKTENAEQEIKESEDVVILTELTEEEKRAIGYLDAAIENKVELEKRIKIVENKLPNLNINNYKNLLNTL